MNDNMGDSLGPVVTAEEIFVETAGYSEFLNETSYF